MYVCMCVKLAKAVLEAQRTKKYIKGIYKQGHHPADTTMTSQIL